MCLVFLKKKKKNYKGVTIQYKGVKELVMRGELQQGIFVNAFDPQVRVSKSSFQTSGENEYAFIALPVCGRI